MNEPNTQQDQAASPPAKKMSSRATNFLMMNAGVPGSDATESQSAPPEPTPSEPSPPEQPARRQTGVVSSTIHPAQRPGNTPQEPSPESVSAARTSKLSSSKSKTSQPLDPEAKAKMQEEKIDKLADRITDVLKRIKDFQTGMLNSEMQTSEKIHMMAGNSPGMMKFLAVLLTQLEPMIKLVQRINEKLIEKNIVRGRGPIRNTEAEEELPPEDFTPPPPEKVSFIELAEKNIIFCDNRKRPLYSLEQMRGKHGYTASEEVLAPMILQNIVEAFHEVAPKARAIPTPTAGIYANIPMDQVMENISDEEIMRFLNYVQRFPRGYVGKNFRITESFAGWVVSGTPDD